MAVVKELQSKTLQVVVDTGVAEETKSYSFSGINSSATDAGLRATGVSLNSLMDSELNSVGVTEKSKLVEEA